MDKDYINRKIENCEKLVEIAISEDQRIVYQGYLNHWTAKLPKKDRPEEIAKKEEAKVKKEAEAEAKAFELKKQTEELAEAERLKTLAAETKAEKIAAKKAELAELEAEIVGIVIEEPEWGKVEDQLELAIDFEREFPNKKAYRYQNGDKIKTIAFIEYLNLRTQ